LLRNYAIIVKTEIGTANNSGSYPAFILIMLVFIIAGSNLFSQNIRSGVSRQSSIEAFSRGDYEKAYSEFSGLLIIYPKDPLYKYYSGVCLVKLNRDLKQAVSLLSQAQQGAAVVRTIPSDAEFWLGRARQLAGDFKGAQDSYYLFTEQAGKKTAKELDVPEFIQQCKENMGQESETDQVTTVTLRGNIPSSQPGGKNIIKADGFRKDESKIIPGKETLPVDYDIILSEALDYQYKADSVYRIAEEQKKNLENLSYREKTDLRAIIAETESLAASFQNIADHKYAEALMQMNKAPFTGGNVKKYNDFLSADTVETLKQSKIVPEPEIVVRKDTLNIIPDTLKRKEKAGIPSEQVHKDQEKLLAVNKESSPPLQVPGEVYALFVVNTKPSGKPDEKVVIGPEIPEGLIYRIQVAVFRNPITYSYFKGLRPVYGFRVPGTDKTNYYVGMFRRLADAKKALLTVRQRGFKDAFIVSLSDGKPVSAERAAMLEKVWGKKPFSARLNTSTEIPADTLPPTLSFRVEVTRATKPVKDDIIEGMKKMAGTRGLDSETLSNGIIVYLIGKFITYESAEDFAGLLIRNGYRDAKVAAWLGKKEIPVETAKQLFERIE
jgi:tetratricopeptide (TPR) repeat protein